MKALIKTVSIIVVTLPLLACDTMEGLWGNSPSAPPPPPNQHPTNYHSRYGNRPVSGATAQAANQPVAQKNQSDVSMVEHGNTSAPTPAASSKVNKGSHDTPMVPGEAPSVE